MKAWARNMCSPSILLHFIFSKKVITSIEALFGLPYLSLSVDTRTCETVCESLYGNNLCHVYKLFPVYFHKLSRIGYEK